jgi:ribA/ribD-fused uncharacterized protein
MSKSSTASVSSDLAALTKAIQALVEQQATNNKLVTAVLERLASAKPAIGGAGKPVADAAEPVKGKRGRKPKTDKEPKVKAAPPPPEDGVVRFGSASEGDYKEFSSFFKSPFAYEGKEYISLANFFHSCKFAGTDDDFAEEIRIQKNPALTRAKASSKDHAPNARWESDKVDLMRIGIVAKFSMNSALCRKLLATGDARIESTIEEEMRVKGFWSIGEDGTGANRMGKLLMSVRDEFRSSGEYDDLSDDEAVAPVTPAPKAKKAPKAPVVKKAAASAKKAAPAASADSDSDDSGDETEAPVAKPKPVAKVTKAPAPAPAPVPVPAKPAMADSDSDESESEEEN